VLGGWFLIQSPGKGCSHIANSLNEHIINMGKKAAEISEEDFQTQVNAVRIQVTEKDKSQAEEFRRIWGDEIS